MCVAVLVCLAGCRDTPPQRDAFVRPVVVPEYPLALSNPQQQQVTWPLWGGAFVIGGELSIRASLAATGTGGLLIAGPGAQDERAELELVADGGVWTLREIVGGEAVEELAAELGEDELIIELRASEVRVAGSLAELAHELSEPLGPEGGEAGLYVTLAAGAELVIDDLALSEPLPSHPELGQPLRELSDTHGVEIGTALDVWPPLHDLELESLLGQQFDSIAPTEFYWPTTRGEDQDFFLLPADLAVNYGLVHEQAITGMFLIWDYALPAWVVQLQASGDTPALEATFDEHITTLVERYAGRVGAWIVVNEAIWGAADIDGPAQLAETSWYEALGPDYIERAFELARAADPNATLLYNETGAEQLNDKSDFMYAMLVELLEREVPIDGVGLQFHVQAADPPDMAQVQANMQRFGELGLAVHVTELDVSLEGVELPEQEALALQAEIYADVLETCLAVPACRSWTVFGFGDRYAWDELGDAAPLLFDGEYQPKPAFFAVQEALAGRD